MILKTFSTSKADPEDGPAANTQSNFPLFQHKGNCLYENSVTIEKLPEPLTTTSQIKISNVLCKQTGDFLEKVTQVRFQNQVIIIRDRYQFESNLQKNQNNQQKRVHIFKKPLHSEIKNEGKKRVTKNLPKNFIKAFMNYLEEIKDAQNSELLQCKIKLFGSRQKYNNTFIQRIIDDPDLEDYFNSFLKDHAKEWIDKSKIRDKEIHYEAIQVFKRLGMNKRDKKQCNFAQFESYFGPFSDDSQRISELSKDENDSDRQSIIANSSKHEEAEQQINL